MLPVNCIHGYALNPRGRQVSAAQRSTKQPAAAHTQLTAAGRGSCPAMDTHCTCKWALLSVWQASYDGNRDLYSVQSTRSESSQSE